MALNLLEKVQKNLGLAALTKTDPNTQAVKEETDEQKASDLSHACQVAALAGIYNLSRSEEGLISIMGEAAAANWVSLLFGNNSADIVHNIMTYAGAGENTVRDMLNSIASEAVKVIKEDTKGHATHTEVRKFIAAQRDFILSYLPAELGIGKLLNDNTLDDRTNKMEGPVSSLLHKIEKAFSGNETQEQAERKKDKNF